MANNHVNLMVILCNVHSDFSDVNIPSVYCNDVEETKKNIKQNSEYQILLACRENDEDQLNIEFQRGNIREIYILGQRTGRDKRNNKILRVGFDEKMLKHHFVNGVSLFYHENENREWKDGDGTEAKNLNQKCVRLLEKYLDMH